MSPTPETTAWPPRRLLTVDDAQINGLADVLIDCVDGGASVGFMQPMTRERWIGAEGFPTTLNDVRVATSGRRNLGEAVLSTSNIELYDSESRSVFEALRSGVHWCVYGGELLFLRTASLGRDRHRDRPLHHPA